MHLWLLSSLPLASVALLARGQPLAKSQDPQAAQAKPCIVVSLAVSPQEKDRGQLIWSSKNEPLSKDEPCLPVICHLYDDSGNETMYDQSGPFDCTIDGAQQFGQMRPVLLDAARHRYPLLFGEEGEGSVAQKDDAVHWIHQQLGGGAPAGRTNVVESGASDPTNSSSTSSVESWRSWFSSWLGHSSNQEEQREYIATNKRLNKELREYQATIKRLNKENAALKLKLEQAHSDSSNIIAQTMGSVSDVSDPSHENVSDVLNTNAPNSTAGSADSSPPSTSDESLTARAWSNSSSSFPRAVSRAWSHSKTSLSSAAAQAWTCLRGFFHSADGPTHSSNDTNSDGGKDKSGDLTATPDAEPPSSEQTSPHSSSPSEITQELPSLPTDSSTIRVDPSEAGHFSSRGSIDAGDADATASASPSETPSPEEAATSKPKWPWFDWLTNSVSSLVGGSSPERVQEDTPHDSKFEDHGEDDPPRSLATTAISTSTPAPDVVAAGAALPPAAGVTDAKEKPKTLSIRPPPPPPSPQQTQQSADSAVDAKREEAKAGGFGPNSAKEAEAEADASREEQRAGQAERHTEHEQQDEGLQSEEVHNKERTKKEDEEPEMSEEKKKAPCEDASSCQAILICLSLVFGCVLVAAGCFAWNVARRARDSVYEELDLERQSHAGTKEARQEDQATIKRLNEENQRLQGEYNRLTLQHRHLEDTAHRTTSLEEQLSSTALSESVSGRSQLSPSGFEAFRALPDDADDASADADIGADREDLEREASHDEEAPLIEVRHKAPCSITSSVGGLPSQPALEQTEQGDTSFPTAAPATTATTAAVSEPHPSFCSSASSSSSSSSTPPRHTTNGRSCPTTKGPESRHSSPTRAQATQPTGGEDAFSLPHDYLNVFQTKAQIDLCSKLLNELRVHWENASAGAEDTRRAVLKKLPLQFHPDKATCEEDRQAREVVCQWFNKEWLPLNRTWYLEPISLG